MAFVPKLNKKKAPTYRIDENLLNEIADYIVKGCPHRIASLSCGVSYTHFKHMLAQGELDIGAAIDSMHARFVLRMKKNERTDIIRRVAKITESEKGHQGEQWYLERKYWQHFSSRTDTIELAAQVEELKDALLKKKDVENAEEK